MKKLTAMTDISAAHITELTRQRDALLAQVEEMRALIQTIPAIITGARLDAKEGVPTQYDYERHAKVTQVRV